MDPAQKPTEETKQSKEEVPENQEEEEDLVDNKKTATLDDEPEDEQIACKDESSGTDISQNDLQYLLADKTWKETWKEAINIKKVDGADKLIDKLVELGFAKPSKIQSKTVPFALIKRDVGILAQSRCGSGKTLGFVIPAVLRIDVSKPLNKSPKTYLPQALIIASTRELCTEIIKIVELIAQPFPEIKVSSGTSAAHIVVRTPKSLLKMIADKEIDLSNIDLVVLDEAKSVKSNFLGFYLSKIAKNSKLFLATCSLLSIVSKVFLRAALVLVLFLEKLNLFNMLLMLCKEISLSSNLKVSHKFFLKSSSVEQTFFGIKKKFSSSSYITRGIVNFFGCTFISSFFFF